MEGKSVEAQLSALLGAIYDSLRTMLSDHLEQLFSGSVESGLALNSLLKDGAFMRFEEDETAWNDLEDDIRKLALGSLVPGAWKVAPTMQNGDSDKYSNPFFV